MRIFVTGATGWIGSATVSELLSGGHDVVGLVRWASSATGLAATGATPLRGDLEDLASLHRGATDADAVIHLANKHDWGNPEENDRTERAAVQTMLEALDGTGKAFLVANGLSGLVAGRPATEDDPSPAVGPGSDRGGSENLVLDSVGHGVRGIAIRFAPSVHGHGDWGFVKFLAEVVRERGVSGFIGDGDAQWSAVHRGDTARLIRLGVEGAEAGTRLHAVAEEALSTRAIAEALGDAFGVATVSIAPEDADDHFGFMAEHFAATMTGTSHRTRAAVGWQSTGPTLAADIRAGAYGRPR